MGKQGVVFAEPRTATDFFLSMDGILRIDLEAFRADRK
jgi:hypothetical protein